MNKAQLVLGISDRDDLEIMVNLHSVSVHAKHASVLGSAASWRREALEMWHQNAFWSYDSCILGAKHAMQIAMGMDRQLILSPLP